MLDSAAASLSGNIRDEAARGLEVTERTLALDDRVDAPPHELEQLRAMAPVGGPPGDPIDWPRGVVPQQRVRLGEYEGVLQHLPLGVREHSLNQ